MHLAALIAVGVVAALHVVFALLEGVLFTQEVGLQVFKQTAEEAQTRKVFAQNQALYNLFLVAGLVWSVIATDLQVAYQLQLFFLGCVVLAGIVGGLTASKGILFVQAVPGAIALGLVIAANTLG